MDMKTQKRQEDKWRRNYPMKTRKKHEDAIARLGDIDWRAEKEMVHKNRNPCER